jgi:zinc protease
VPVVQVNLLIGAGAAADPAGRSGLASLTAAMLQDGAGSRSALDVADAIDFLGADLRTSSDFDVSTIRLHVPVEHLADALPVMADIAERPTFPAAELARAQRARLTSILQSRDDPSALAEAAFPLLLYGESNRYGTPTSGTAANIRSFTPADLRGFYQAWYRPSNAHLVVVGDVKPDRIMPLLERSFGGWNVEGREPARPAVGAATQPARRQIYLVDKPGAAQSEIRIGWIGVARSTPDFFPITVMNTILGGSFTSRLNQNLREQHGYTYGAGSGFEMRVGAGPFVAGAAVQTDETADALREFFNEFNGMRGPLPVPDIERAKKYVALRFPGAFEQTASIARRLEQLIVFDLPRTYFEEYQARIAAVSPADVERVARTWIQPDRFIVVIVGDQAKIEPGIEALKLGPITRVTADRIFGPVVRPD